MKMSRRGYIELHSHLKVFKQAISLMRDWLAYSIRQRKTKIQRHQVWEYCTPPTNLQIISKRHSNIIYLLAISVAISILIFLLFVQLSKHIKSHVFRGKPVWV